MKKSTLIKLALMGTALVILPRRSSKKAECSTGCDCLPLKGATDEKVTNKKAGDTSGDSMNGDDSKSCKCPLCRIGKCPLCAIGKCFCCKKSTSKAKKKGCCSGGKKTNA